jgi:ubiquinone/menaquinone biosynthesis C-methylase UbiE
MASASKPDWNDFGRANAARQWRKQSATMGADVTGAIVEAAQIEPGMHILDVACGTGEPSISLATELSGTGEVIGTDIVSEPLKVAQERAAGHKLTNVRFQFADVHELPFADNTFDRVTSRFGVMFFADLPRAANEMRRVLKPNGRLVLLAWGPMDQPYFRTMVATLLRTIPDAELPESGKQVFAFGQTGRLTQTLTMAGFKTVDEKLRTVPWTWPGTPGEVWAYFQEVAVPFMPLLKSIPQERRGEVDEAVLHAISPYYDGREIKFTATANITSALK